MSEDLVTWLRAQIDEDERVACAAVGAPSDPGTIQDLPSSGPWSDFDTRFDPARVLAEVEAKRRILDEHDPSHDPCDAHDAALRTITCDTVRLLALPYADREGWREEWRV